LIRHILPKISPNPSFPSGPEAKEGEFLPFVKGGKEGLSLQCPYNYAGSVLGPRVRSMLA